MTRIPSRHVTAVRSILMRPSRWLALDGLFSAVTLLSMASIEADASVWGGWNPSQTVEQQVAHTPWQNQTPVYGDAPLPFDVPQYSAELPFGMETNDAYMYGPHSLTAEAPQDRQTHEDMKKGLSPEGAAVEREAVKWRRSQKHSLWNSLTSYLTEKQTVKFLFSLGCFIALNIFIGFVSKTLLGLVHVFLAFKSVSYIFKLVNEIFDETEETKPQPT